MDTTFIKIKKEFGGKNIIKKYIKQYIHKIPLPENIKKQITDKTETTHHRSQHRTVLLNTSLIHINK